MIKVRLKQNIFYTLLKVIMEGADTMETKEKFFDKIRDIIKGHKWYVFIILVLAVFVVK
jgi:hypothetical protein